MAREKLANIDDGVLSLGADLNNSATSLTLGGTVTGLPTSNFRLRIDDELVLVGSRSSTSCTSVTRGVEGTTAASHTSAGAVVTAPLTAAGFYGAMPGATNVSAAMSTSPGYQDLTNSFADVTGLSLSLPEAGTYLVCLNLRGGMSVGNGESPFIVTQLVDGSGTPYSNTTLLAVYSNNASGSTITAISSSGFGFLVTASGAATVKLQAKSAGTGGTNIRIQSDSNGLSTISAARIA